MTKLPETVQLAYLQAFETSIKVDMQRAARRAQISTPSDGAFQFRYYGAPAASGVGSRVAPIGMQEVSRGILETNPLFLNQSDVMDR